jgi:membrane protease YdiL (CAAX protease family)
MPEELPSPKDNNSIAANSMAPQDESPPMDVLPAEEEPAEDSSIPSAPVLDLTDESLAAYSDEDQLPPRKPRPPHPGFWFAVLWCLAYQALQLAAGIAVAIVVGIGWAIVSQANKAKPNPFDAAKLEEQSAAPTFVYCAILGLLFAWLVVRLIVGKQWQRRLALLRPSWTNMLLAVLALPGVIYLSQGIYELALFLHFPTFAYQQFLTKIFATLPWWFGVLVIGVAPAITEELLFRGFIGRGLVARHGPVVGVLLTSLLFGLNHLDPPHIAATFAMGVYYHYAYLMTRSLWIPMLMHFLNNSWSVLGMLLQPESLAQVDDAPPAYLIAAAAILALAVAWAFYDGRARLVMPPETDGPGWKPAFAGVEAPPPGSGTQVARSWPGWAAGSAVFLAVMTFAAAFVLAVA